TKVTIDGNAVAASRIESQDGSAFVDTDLAGNSGVVSSVLGGSAGAYQDSVLLRQNPVDTNSRIAPSASLFASGAELSDSVGYKFEHGVFVGIEETLDATFFDGFYHNFGAPTYIPAWDTENT